MGIFDRQAASAPSEAPELTLDEQIIHAIRQVYDPEIPVNVYDLGLIYKVERDQETNKVNVDMTLTSPACPAAQELPLDVKHSVERVPGVTGAEVEIVWDPPWGPEQMTEEAKLELGFM